MYTLFFEGLSRRAIEFLLFDDQPSDNAADLRLGAVWGSPPNGVCAQTAWVTLPSVSKTATAAMPIVSARAKPDSRLMDNPP
jgi:hypothetical protein